MFLITTCNMASGEKDHQAQWFLSTQLDRLMSIQHLPTLFHVMCEIFAILALRLSNTVDTIILSNHCQRYWIVSQALQLASIDSCERCQYTAFYVTKVRLSEPFMLCDVTHQSTFIYYGCHQLQVWCCCFGAN